MSEKKNNWFKRHKILTVVGVFIALIIIIGALSDSSQTDTSVKSVNSGQEATAKTNTQTETATPKAAPKQETSVPAEYKSALAQADTYASTVHMSKAGLYDQLTSDYGGQFSKKAAQYAIDNVQADWNANALAKAKSYQDTMHMSPAAIHDQLTSSYGEKFTTKQADYAIAHLND